jgi:hypothetical protein
VDDVKLPDFEGECVDESACRITKAGDGLSDALAIAVYFVLKGEVTQVNHRSKSASDDTLVRVYTIDTREITRVDEGDVRMFLDTASEKISKAAEARRLAEEEAAGIQQLPEPA